MKILLRLRALVLLFVLACSANTSAAIDGAQPSTLKSAAQGAFAPHANASYRDKAATAVAITLAPNTYNSFYLDLPSNIASATITTTGATGEADLLIRQGIPHTATTLQGLFDQSSHVANAAGGNETITITRSSARPITPGRWWLTVINPSAATVTVQLDAVPTVSGSPYAVSAGQSGTWYQPSKTYQGFFIEMLSPTSALAVWFTFHPDGRQAYLTGVGNVVGDSIVFPEMTRTRGGKYGSAFIAANVVRENWGSLLLTYDACGSGYASYAPSTLAAQQGWPNEQLQIARLTTISGLPCPAPFSAKNAASTDAQAKYLRNGIAGAWYDTSRSGEGWLVETLSDTASLVYWFSYTPTGEQAWWGGVGDIVNGSITVNAATQPTGGRFGEGYNPAQVTLNPWGPFALTFTACNKAVLSAYGPAAYGPFNDPNLVRLTSLAGTSPCGFAVAPVALSGSAQALPGSFADGDTNNPATPNRDNDSPAQEQVLSNPAIVSGFLAATGTGRNGDRFQTATDIYDAYTLPMVQGQVIRLAIADHQASAPTAIDFDLLLYPADNANQPIAISEGTGPVEQIIVPSSGNFDIVLKAYAGFGNYVLSVDNSGTAMASVPGALSSLSKTSAGDIIVALKTPDASVGKAARTASEFGLQLQAGAADRSMLFNIGDHTQSKAAAKALGINADGGLLSASSPWKISNPEHRANHQLIQYIKALRARPDIDYAEPNYIAEAMAVPNDQLYRLQWHYPMINLPQAWDITTGSRNVVVAVIDSGVVNHPDLANVDWTLGADFVRDRQLSGDGDGIDPNAFDDGGRISRPWSYHGTHVAGTIGASSNNGIGVAGVNWNTTIMPVRVGGPRGVQQWDVVQGIRWAARLPNDSLTIPSRKADVMNLSLGGANPTCPDHYASAIAAARAAGVTVIVAAGNDSTSAPATPANCLGAIAVSAVDQTQQKAHYSNSGGHIAVAAPGGCGLDPQQTSCDVWSTTASNASGSIVINVGAMPGTSMAAPHVAGVVALMKSVYPAMTPTQFDGLLASGAITRDLGTPGKDQLYGHGLIDAFKAVGEARRLATAQTLPPVPGITPSALDFGTNLSTQTVSLSNIGQGSLNVTGVSTNKTWLSVSAQSINPQGLGTYTIAVNRSGLVAAAHAGTVTFTTNTGPVIVTVSMRVGASQLAGDASTVYVLVIDALTGQVVHGATSNGNSGIYPWSLPSVLPGNYYILAGSDMDNDYTICDAGESCGAYFTLSDPSLINLTAPTNLASFAVLPPAGSLSGSGSTPPAKTLGIQPTLERRRAAK